MTVVLVCNKKEKKLYLEVLSKTPHKLLATEYSINPNTADKIMDNNNPHIVIIVEGFANKKTIPLHHFTSQLKQRRDSIRVIYIHDKEKPMTDIQSLADSFSEQGIYDIINNADIETRLPNVIDFPLSDGNVDLPTNNDNYTYIPPLKTNKTKPYRKRKKFKITTLLNKYDIPVSMIVMVGIVLTFLFFVIAFTQCSGKNNSDYSSADNSSELKLVEEITQTETTITIKETTLITTSKAEETEGIETTEGVAKSQNTPQIETNKAEITPSKPNNQTPTPQPTPTPTPQTTQAPTPTPEPTPQPTPAPTTQAPETVPPIQVKVNGIKLSTSASDNNVILNIGSQSKITPVISPTNATNKTVTWTSNRPDIAIVDSTGTVTATGSGKAIITATTADGGLSASCMITVN